jgi:hypothetical protein
VPWAIANAADKQQKDNGGVTQITESRADDRQWMAQGRQHLVNTALAFIKRFVT